MIPPFRLTIVLAAAAMALPACKSVNKALDATIGVFEAKDRGAAEGGEESGGRPAATADYNTALLVVEVNGVRRKIVIELDPATAPRTVENFKKLVNERFYDGLAFHRALRNYIVQTGDPASRDNDRRSEWGLTDVGYRLPAETGGKHVRGAVAMARPGPLDAGDKSSSGSQFYICLRTQRRLDGHYTVFGRVIRGLEVLDAIGSVPVDTNDAPIRRVEVVSLSLVPPDSPDLKEEPQDRRRSKPDAEKGAFEKFIERIW